MREAVQVFFRAVREVDIHARIGASKTTNCFRKVSQIPTNSKMDEDFKIQQSDWKGRRDQIIYLDLHTTATASAIKQGHRFQRMKDEGVRAWKDVWETEPFSKIGWLANIHPSLHQVDDIHQEIDRKLKILSTEMMNDESEIMFFSRLNIGLLEMGKTV